MTVTVLVFSTLRKVVGQDALSIALPESCDVADLLERLYADYPSLAEWDAQLLVAVDQDYATRGTELSDGQEVAIMPPVQGG